MKKFKNKNFFESLKNAFNGLVFIFRFHKHFRTELFLALLAIVFSILFNLNFFEFLIVLLTIFLVLITETFNTLFEEICNLLKPNYDEKIKIIKDISSASVLLAVIFSLIVFIFVFLPKLFLVLY